MIAKYQGYEINVTREGDCALYYSITRERDGWEADCAPYYGCEGVREFIEILKQRIDNEHATGDPWMEQEELFG